MGTFEIVLATATIAGGIAAVWFFWDKLSVLFGKIFSPNVKGLPPKDILMSIEINTSLDRVKDILSYPHKIYDTVSPIFSEEEIKTLCWHYNFKECAIEIESDDGKSVKVITMRTYGESNLFTVPFWTSLGELTFAEVLEYRNTETVYCFTSMRDSLLATELFMGRIGGFLTYTLGCDDLSDTRDCVFTQGKLIGKTGEEIDVTKLKVNFISIAQDENRGHSIN